MIKRQIGYQYEQRKLQCWFSISMWYLTHELFKYALKHKQAHAKRLLFALYFG